MQPSPCCNLEWKARHADLPRARVAARQLGATAAATELQTDTYFHVPHGRLKLREIEGQPAVLIWYDRPDRLAERFSSYHLVAVPDPARLKAALRAALGIRGEVRKRREIYLWHNIRIHLDEVSGLGTFVEFEAVLGSSAEAAIAAERLEELGRVLGIRAADRLVGSYADLLGL